MNDAMTPTALATTAVFLAVATAVTVALVALAARGLREPGSHRTLWRAALVTIFTLFVGESTGLFAAGGAWMRHQLASLQLTLNTAAQKSAAATDTESPNFKAIHEALDSTAASAASIDSRPLDTAAIEEGLAGYEYDLAVELAVVELPEDVVPPEAELSEREVERTEAIAAAPAAKDEVASAPTLTIAPSGMVIPWQRVFGWTWAMIAVALTLRLTFARFVWLWRYRHARPVGDREIKQCVGALARELGLRRRVAIWSSPRWVAPVAWGVWRPSIGLPEDFLETYSQAERDAMLAHELGHLAARDPAWQCLADSVVALLWWAPWCWWLRRQLRIAAEWMADEASLLVTDGPQALAECLVLLGRRMTPEPAASFSVTGSFRSNLGRRVERLLKLAETTGVDGCARRPDRWRMPALALCVALSMVAGSAWARSGIESTQGADDMRWFEQSWRRSLAGGIVSLALGAPTTAVLAEEVDFEVAVAVDDDDDNDDDGDDEAEAAAEAAEDAAEEAAEEAEEAAEKAEEAAEESAEEAEEAAEEAADKADDDADDDDDDSDEKQDDGDDDDEDFNVDIEVEIEAVGEEIAAAMEEVDAELAGALDEVSVEIEAAMSEVSEELDSALAEADEAVVQVQAEVDVAIEEAQAEGGDEAAEEVKQKAAAKAEEAKAKAIQKAMEGKEKALEMLKEKLGEGLKDREEKTRAMHEKMQKQREKAVRKLEEAQAKAKEKLHAAREKDGPEADELEGKLQKQLGQMERQMAEQEEMMRHQMQEAERALHDAHRDAAERMEMEQHQIEERIQQQLGKDGEERVVLRKRLKDQNQQRGKARGQLLKARADQKRAGERTAIEAQQKHLQDLIWKLHEQGHGEAADQVEEALKQLIGEEEEEEVKGDKESNGKQGPDGELQGRVDQLQGEVSALRDEIGALRDLLKQALSEKKDSPPAP